MIRRYLTYGISSLLLLFWVACQQEQLTESAKGILQITLAEDTLGVQTKSSPAALTDEVMGLFQITVRNTAGFTFFEGDLISSEVALPSGLYTVRASYGTDSPIALDAPYYLGELSNVEIKAGQTTPIIVTCKVMNALLSINWSNRAKFDQVYSDYGVQVKVGNASVTLRPDSQQSAYLQAGVAYALTFVGTVKETRTEVSIPLTDTKIPTSLAAGDHCTLTLNTDSKTALQVQKAEIDRTTIQESIPLEWLPAPIVNAQGFEGNQLSFYETDAPVAQLNFDLSGPLQELAFTLALDAESPYADLNGDYTLSTLTAEQKGRLIRAGFILPDIGVQAGACLSLSGFLSNLLADNERERPNQITLTHLKANGKDIAQPLTYTITVKKPEFSVSVDERNCWAREFTIDEITMQHGNEATIKSQLVYQYFDGANWVDCQTREQVKGRTQQFTEAAEAIVNKSYRVRALYRGAIASSEATATLENPDQLPNSDMEEWRLDIYQDDLLATRISYDPWDEGQSAGFWDTNNRFTTRHRTNSSAATMANYNGMPAVSLVPGRSGLAAELRSTANGKANTLLSDGRKDYNKVAGELYTGTAKVTTGGNDANASSDTHERIKDSQFASRPSALYFWYKYAPFDDTEKFSVTIELLDEQKNVIATSYQEYGGSTDATWQEIDLPVAYTANEKCAFVHVLFCSTTVTGANMKFEECTYTLYKSLTDTYSFNRAYVGSILTIDDIQLIYDK